MPKAKMGGAKEVSGMCRLCAACCVMRFTLDEAGRVIGARGDHDHQITKGYACSKGLTLHEQHHDSERLLHPLKRLPDGSFERIALDAALEEIAAKIRATIDRAGPDAVAAFRGMLTCSNVLLRAFLRPLGSRSFFSTMTIDQSAKWVRSGWASGRPERIHSTLPMCCC